MISDILIILSIALFVFLGYRRGLARTLLNLAALVAAAVIGNAASQPIAQGIYDTFIKQGVIDNLQTTIVNQGAETAISTSLDSAPSWINGILGGLLQIFGLTTDDFQRTLQLSNDTSLTLAQNLEKPVGTVTVSILSLIMYALIFTVLMVIFKLIIRKVAAIFDIPVVAPVNRVLGGILGLVEGAVLVIVAVNLIYVLTVTVNPGVFKSTAVFGPVFQFLCFFK